MRHGRNSVLATFVTALLIVAPRAANGAIQDLGNISGAIFAEEGRGRVNNVGQVTGTFSSGGPLSLRAFRTAPYTAIAVADDLGSLGGALSFGYSINDAGQVVGRSFVTGNVYHAYRTAPNGTINSASDLGTLPGTTNSVAYDINATGQAVGYADVPTTGELRAFRTAANGAISALSDLGTLGGTNTSAYGINDLGQAVGSSYLANNIANHAFRTAPNGSITPQSDIGTFGGALSLANGINNAGQTIGFSMLPDNIRIHAFRTVPNGVIDAASDLGTLGGDVSAPDDINALGQVVGASTLVPGGFTSHAFFVDETGPMTDLNTLLPANSGWVLTRATGINDLGQISGYGTINGETHAFLMTIPEPTSLALFAASAPLASRRRSRRYMAN